jgi:TonB family protein
MASSLSLSSTSSAPDLEANSSVPSDGHKSDPAPSLAQNSNAEAQSADQTLSQNASSSMPAETATGSTPADVFSILRRTADGSQPPDSVIRATAEAARVLTLADGVAIAFRTKGVILCRARSGELAPELGSYVDANSGISGECLRTASIMVCDDARVDARVDNVICQRMGIRSIVVVPLRGPVGISGILEIFSTRAKAFGEREINSLRGLAELAEAAYARERLAQLEATRAALRSAHRLPALLSRSVGAESDSEGRARELRLYEGEAGDPRPERLIWAIGVATAALLLILGVWLSWHGPISELAELEAAENHSPVPTAPELKQVLPSPKPAAGLIRSENGRRPSSAHEGSRAKADPSEHAVGEEAKASTSLVNAPAAGKILSEASNSESVMQAPSVKFASAPNAGELAGVFSAHETLPVMDAPLSRGVRQGELIHRVDPVYPPQARAQRITGSVVVEIRVGKDGRVRDVSTIRGDAQLVTAAVAAVRQWQYAPTLLDGNPIEATKRVTVIFKLP